MSVVPMKSLLEAGVHFGHRTRRWNPKMKPYIFGARNGIYIIDLQKTVPLFQRADEFLVTTVANGGKVQIPGFGTFSVSHRAARKGRNPQTGETIDIAASVPVVRRKRREVVFVPTVGFRSSSRQVLPTAPIRSSVRRSVSRSPARKLRRIGTRAGRTSYVIWTLM